MFAAPGGPCPGEWIFTSKLFVTTLAAAVTRLRPDVLSNAVDPGWVKLVEGRPRVPDRQALCGILFVPRTGIQWECLPQELGFGSGMTCWRRLAAWNEAGVWDEPHHAERAADILLMLRDELAVGLTSTIPHGSGPPFRRHSPGCSAKVARRRNGARQPGRGDRLHRSKSSGRAGGSQPVSGSRGVRRACRKRPGATPKARLKALAKANSEVYPTRRATTPRESSPARRIRAAVLSRHHVR
ncbi:transposase [Streptomyces sp. V4I2]|nr:transposase [Streptomyces sp. V4I2]